MISCYNKNTKVINPKNLFGWDLEHVILCCPGPSLSDVNGDDIRRPGLVIAGLNTVYPKIKPDIWFGMDDPACYHSCLPKEPFIKFFRDCYSNTAVGGVPVHRYFNTYFTTVEEHPNGIAGMIDKEFLFVPWYKHTLGVALYVLMKMGARNIYLVGCDMGGEKDYFDDRKLDDKKREYNRNLYSAQIKFLFQVRAMAYTLGVNIFNSTPGSPLNDGMAYVDLSDLLAMFPPPGDEQLLHATKITESKIETATKDLYWKTPKQQRGVVLMADKEQQWMLPWWVENFRKHNNLPIHFVSIGMDDEMAAWCLEQGSVSVLPEFPMKAWFKKPFALMQTPFYESIFIDNDCEVLSDVSPLFNYLKGFDFAVAADKITSFSIGDKPVNTGVIAYRYSSKLIEEWARDTVVNNFFFRSDQEILQSMLSLSHDHDYIEVPEKYNWIRLRGENPDAVIFHWTGPQGKEVIKLKLKNITNDVVAN